jgi:histidine ammonia-lyase
MPGVVMLVADRVEDRAPMALSTVEKTGEVVDHLRLLAAIELMVAAQACDLREGIMLGAGTRLIHQKLSAIVAPLGDDRATSPDIKALQALIHGGALDDLVCISPEDR